MSESALEVFAQTRYGCGNVNWSQRGDLADVVAAANEVALEAARTCADCREGGLQLEVVTRMALPITPASREERR